ncbi:MAG: magnesium/cobalt transporter CorA [Actinobacteria bacterium]|nr:magnesium/cobalt transporter CorA [Actinomycetota bacterium]
MIEVCTYTDAGARDDIDPTDISEVVGRDGTLVWIDALDPDDDDFVCIREELSLHPLAIEDARKHGQRPKLELYPSHAFVVAYSAALAEVDIFVGPGWVVTIRGCGEDGEAWPLDHARKRFERTGPGETTSGFLLYTILDDLVDGYFGRADRSEDLLEDLEERIFAEQLGDERQMQQDLYELRRELVGFRRRVQPLREVMNSILRREVKWIDEVALTHFQDVYDHVLRATEQIDAQRELMGNAVDAHLAIISNHMNQVMKKMTSWGALLLGSTLIAGIYGMNFEHMPELGWEFGYPYAIGLMLVVTITGYLSFRRRDWL